MSSDPEAINPPALPAPAPGEWRPPMLQDFLDQLIWPKLLRGPAFALAPTRVGIGFFVVLVLALLWRLPELWITGPTPADEGLAQLRWAWDAITESILTMQPRALATAVGALFYGVPAATLATHPTTTILLALVSVWVWCVGVGAISRSAACEFSRDIVMTWPQALGYSLGRWPSLVSAVLVPLVLVAVIALVIAGAGAGLLTWPVGDVIGALLYPVALVLAAVAVICIAGYLLGQQLLVPAVVCEGTDAIDGVQRTYAYVVGRPLRLIVYLLIAALAAGLALLVAAAIAIGITSFTSTAAAYWSGARGGEIVSGSPMPEGGTARAAASIIRMFAAIPLGLLGGYIVSVYASGSTLLYLLLRQVNDGQEFGELWMPGMAEGTTAHAPAEPSDDDDEE